MKLPIALFKFTLTAALIIPLTMVFPILSASAQTSDTISTGRPGISIGPDVVGTQIFQIQSGLDFYDFSSANSDTLLQNNVVRFGLSEAFELNANFDLVSIKNNRGSDQKGIDNVAIGGRVNLIAEAKGWVPALGLQTRLLLPVKGTFAKSDAKPIVLMSANFLPWNNGVITTNAGLSYDGNNPAATYNYTLAYTHTLSEKWSVFIEEYGNFINDEHIPYLDAGAAYVLNKNTILDFSFGVDISSRVDQKFVSTGISWRALP